MEFYEMLIMLRKKNGISQEEFGQTIGVSRQAVSKWESGESMLDIEKLKRISNYYGLTIDDLLNGKVDGKTNGLNARLIISSGLNISSLIIASFWYSYSMDQWSVLCGVMILTISMMLYGLTINAYGKNHRSICFYWMINTWLISFLPMALFFNFLTVRLAAPYPLLFANSWIAYGLFWIVYILLNGAIMVKMVKTISLTKK